MDSKQVIVRFEAERQALALLDHPNIAQVYDAGTTEDGRPYFCMEYVGGLPITEHCDHQRLSIEERLQLFIQVCEGVQHAHQKGIIHRDIKPSNVLVSAEDHRALPKIIDFGVAKALAAPLTERTLFTAQGQLLGTPEYMSPEQAEMNQEDIDVRSDIYSLGVMLYELLTGALPFDRSRLEQAGLAEILRVIREQDPPRPSACLSSLGAEAKQVADSRKTGPNLLSRLLRGDLDWIVMRALEKDRARRYSSATELVADIQRHLNNEPVQAGPPTVSYKLRKFIRRHRAATLASLFVVTALIVGTVLATYGLFQARRERDRALKAEGETFDEQAASLWVYQHFFESANEKPVEGYDQTLRSMLEAASDSLKQKPVERPLAEARIRSMLAQTYQNLGEYERAMEHFQHALDLWQSQLGAENQATVASLMDLGYVHFCQGRWERATQLLIQAKEIQERTLGPEHLDTLKSAILLGRAYQVQGLLDQAAAQLEQVLETDQGVLGQEDPDRVLCMVALADVRLNQERYEDAEELCHEVLRIRQDKQGDKHRTLEAMSKLVIVYIHQERYVEAEPHCRTALETSREVLGADAPLTLVLMNNLGRICKEQKHYDEALKLLILAADSYARKTQGKPHPVTVGHLIDIYTALGRSEEAKKWRAKLPGNEATRDDFGRHP
jgi:non-specific serine/threonine protein kinase/serine/threonine-protein kinase